jgi:hypothetical protein
VIAAIGWAGAAVLLAGYGLGATGRLRATGRTYLLLNIIGAAGLAVSTVAAHAYSATAVNVAWIAIGGVPLLRATFNRTDKA